MPSTWFWMVWLFGLIHNVSNSTEIIFIEIMRWIFFSLLIMNAATLVWGFVFEKETEMGPSSVQAFSYDAPRLKLLGEGNTELAALNAGRSLTSPGKPKIASLLPLPATVNGKDLCELVGAFKSRELATNFVERLSAIDVKSEIRDLRLPAGPGYWVYLEPTENRRSALRHLAELQARKVDSYVIPKGELENGISLGLFSQENLANLRMKEMQAIGLSPKMDTIERTYREIWVMLRHKEDAKMSSLSWSRAMEGFNKLERRQNFCLDVASEDNFQ